jgi:hypothetical protein
MPLILSSSMVQTSSTFPFILRQRIPLTGWPTKISDGSAEAVSYRDSSKETLAETVRRNSSEEPATVTAAVKNQKRGLRLIYSE